MKTIIIILALAVNSPAAFQLGSDGPGGFSVWHDDHWDWMGVHAEPPQVVPEPSSPLAMLMAAAMALIGRRHRKGCIREKRIDMRTVRFP